MSGLVYTGLISIIGRGGASIYGKEFDDEIHDDLKHSGKYLLFTAYFCSLVT